MPTYSQEDFEQIADAIVTDVADVLQYSNDFEEAARWYRLSTPPTKREGGPTFELRNQALKKVKKPSESRKKRSEKPKTLSELRKKSEQVEAAARKLLLHLGVRHVEEAPDGPGDRELLHFLASYSGSSEEEVINASARIGRLSELLEAIDAAEFLKTCASKAVQEAVDFAKLLPKGHQGDIAAIGWTADMMSLYKKTTGKEPRFSVLRPGAGRGRPTGPFLRFLQAAGGPLGMEFPPASARSRQRALKGAAQRRQK